MPTLDEFNRAYVANLLQCELWCRQMEIAIATDHERVRGIMAQLFTLSAVEEQSRRACANATEAIRQVDELAMRVRNFNAQIERLESRLLRLAELGTTAVAKLPQLLPESSTQPVVGGAYRGSPSGASGGSQTGEVPVGQGVRLRPPCGNPATDGVAERPNDVPNADNVDKAGTAPLAGLARGMGLRIVG